LAGFIVNSQLAVTKKMVMEKLSLAKKIMVAAFILGLALLGGLGGGWLYSDWFGQLANLQNVSNLSNGNGSVVISGAKQVVVQQDTRSAEVIDSAEKVIVGVFKKKGDNNYDLLSGQIAAGALITSDGWLVANWPVNEKTIKLDDYVVITKDKKVYNLDRLVFDAFSNLTFVHLKNSNSLPVAGFSSALDLQRGQTVFLVGWLKTVNPAILTETRRLDEVIGSDQPFKLLALSLAVPNDLLAVDLSGHVVGWITKDKQLTSVDYIINAIDSLLANKPIKKTVLGVNYLNSDYYIRNKQPAGALITKDKKGVAVVTGSPAAEAGLKEGDVITALDDKEIGYGTDLADVIATYQAGDKAIIKYWRGTDKKEAVVTLGGM
jgi:serine protease Do